MYFLKRIGCIIWSLLRLSLIVIMGTLSGIHNIIFNKMEIINMSLMMRPQAPEREKLGFIDKLCAGNLELSANMPVPPADSFDANAEFKPDEMFDEEHEPTDEELEGAEAEIIAFDSDVVQEKVDTAELNIDNLDITEVNEADDIDKGENEDGC